MSTGQISRRARRLAQFIISFFICGFSGWGFATVAFADTPAEVTSNLKETIALVLAGAALLGILGNVAWSFFNRRKFDQKNETISELEKLLEVRKLKSEELETRISELTARHELKIKEAKETLDHLRVSNNVIVRENMQMRAILKKLRLEGKWEGDEDDVWKGYVVK